MRFLKKQKAKYGDTRVVSYFAFVPLTIGDETRWMEVVHVKQSAVGGIMYAAMWVNESFVEDPNKSDLLRAYEPKDTELLRAVDAAPDLLSISPVHSDLWNRLKDNAQETIHAARRQKE